MPAPDNASTSTSTPEPSARNATPPIDSDLPPLRVGQECQSCLPIAFGGERKHVPTQQLVKRVAAAPESWSEFSRRRRVPATESALALARAATAPGRVEEAP